MIKNIRIKQLLVAASLGLALGTAQARDEPMWNPDRVAVQQNANINVDSLRVAIIRAGARRNWQLLDEAPGEVRLKQSRQGKHEATVKIAYDATGYQLSYANSYNLNVDVERQRIHPTYNLWLRNLSGDIASEITLLTLK